MARAGGAVETPVLCRGIITNTIVGLYLFFSCSQSVRTPTDREWWPGRIHKVNRDNLAYFIWVSSYSTPVEADVLLIIKTT